MKKISSLCLFIFGLGFTTLSQAQQLSATQQHGQEVFNKWCAPCHGAFAGGVLGGLGANDLPGTSALAVKYKGDLPKLIEERTDLQPIYIRTIVRTGLYGMPITRKTEVNDADLEAIIAYLTRAR
jgi:mono/diheme cytochrome c family protein